jgi:hypothetical protein
MPVPDNEMIAGIFPKKVITVGSGKIFAILVRPSSKQIYAIMSSTKGSASRTQTLGVFPGTRGFKNHLWTAVVKAAA